MKHLISWYTRQPNGNRLLIKFVVFCLLPVFLIGVIMTYIKVR